MELNILKSLNLKHVVNNTISLIKSLGDKNICIIVPDKFSATMEKLIFERLNIECSFNINVYTLNRLSKNILAETKASYKTISKIGGIILLKKVLNDNQDIITSFKSNNNSYQFSNEIYKTLSQLKSCQLGCEELLNYKCDIKQLEKKINDLGNILQLYTDAKTGVLDNSDTLTLTCMMLDKSELVKDSYFIFSGFDDFTSQGYNLIERLMMYAKGVYVNTYFSSGFNKNIYYQDVLYRLTSMCDSIGAKVNILNPPYEDSDLHKYLTNNLFAFNQLNFNLKSSNEIKLYKADNIRDEIEFVARDIKSKILQGERFYNFGVGVYNLSGNVDNIKQIFNKYELCTYIDIQKPFSSTCVYKFFVNLWQLYLKNYETLNLIEFIDSVFISIPEEDKYNIIQKIKRIEFKGKLSSLNCNDEQINSSINILYNFLTSHTLTANSNIDEVLVWHNNIINELSMENTIYNMLENLEDNYDKKILAQALKYSKQLLEEIAQFYPKAKLNEILDIYMQAGIELAISPLPLSADCIQIVDAGEILTSFDNLYLINCTSSTAPSTFQDLGILPDKELSYVQLSHNIEPTIARINRLNKFKLFNSALMFNKNLTISMTLNSNSEMSSLVNELNNRLFVTNGKNEETNIGYIYPNKIKDNAIYTPLSLWDLIEYAYSNKLESSLDKHLLEKINIQQSPKHLTINPQYSNLTEISASALENYFQCPLKYFFNYVLKLKEPTSANIEMLDIGNILHELAYKYYLCKNRESVDIKLFCQNTIKNLISKNEKLNLHINNPIIINLTAESERFISYLKELDKNSMFIPSYFEKEFGKNKDFPALPLTENIYLKGKIDRIDIYNNYFRIIDYKSGNADASLSELYYGKKLQLFLYGLAIENAIGKKLSGTFYLPIKNVVEKVDNDENIYKLMGFYTDNTELADIYDINLTSNLKSNFVNMSLKKDGSFSKRSEKVLTDNEMENMLNYSKNISIKALKEICSGTFNASPLKFDGTTNACTYCPYLVLCSKSSNNIQFREQSKVTKESFNGGEHE